MATFFTSDIHFSHKNIIKYSNRPWPNIDTMNDGIIKNWNGLINQNDEVYILGDVGFGSVSKMTGLLSSLNGRKNLVLGNHDHQYLKFDQFTKIFERIDNLREIKIDGQPIVLCHYAMKVWNNSHRGAWHLYGHSHGTMPDDPNSLSFDVGMDCHSYLPLSFDRVGTIMARKTWKPIDHHNESTNP